MSTKPGRQVAAVPGLVSASEGGPAGPVRLVTLSERPGQRGNLVIVEGGKEVEFSISRIFFMYDVPVGGFRGGHAHKTLEQCLLAPAGSFNVVVDNGARRARYSLSKPNVGLCIGPMNWVEVRDFSAAAICLVLASLPYDESDYYRDYDAFIHGRLALTGRSEDQPGDARTWQG